MKRNMNNNTINNMEFLNNKLNEDVIIKISNDLHNLKMLNVFRDIKLDIFNDEEVFWNLNDKILYFSSLGNQAMARRLHRILGDAVKYRDNNHICRHRIYLRIMIIEKYRLIFHCYP